MGEKKSSNKSGVYAVVGALLVPFVKPTVDAVIDAAADYIDKTIEERKKLVAVPELYLKGYPLTSTQAIDLLNSCGLNAIIVSTRLADADPKLRNCIDGQVIGSEPRSKQKVEPGRAISIKCITQEVIDESQRLYDEAEIQKANRKIQREDKIEQSKNTITEIAGKIKDVPMLGKKRKNVLELIETKEEIK